MIYADTSFLISLYARDSCSDEARQLADTLKSPFAYTPLHRHEARNALRLAIFRRDISLQESESVMAAMNEDERTGVLANAPLSWAEVFEHAEILSAAHTKKLGTRAMDILHVAAAVALDIREFFTFDKRQKALAVKVGMRVVSSQ